MSRMPVESTRNEFKEAHEAVMGLLLARLKTSRHFGENVFPFESNESRAEVKRALDDSIPWYIDEMDRWEFAAQLFGDAIEEADSNETSPLKVAVNRGFKREDFIERTTQTEVHLETGHVYRVGDSYRAQRSMNCKLCGAWYDTKYPCDVDDELRAFILQYAAGHGEAWKKELRTEWKAATDGLLARARDVIGPNRLRILKLEWLVKPSAEE